MEKSKLLKFVTGNKNKFRETSGLLKPIKVRQIKLNLDEIQDLDPHKVIRHKLLQALKRVKGELIVEDDSLYMECLSGKLPGPFIRFFNDTIGNKGLLKMATSMGNSRVYELVLIGYINRKKQIRFFAGKVHANLVKPRGKTGFGFDPIFKPRNSAKTFAQMSEVEKRNFSARGIAATKLKKYLLKSEKNR